MNQAKHEKRILENLPLAYKVATKYRIHASEDYEDLKSAAVTGLVEASLRFDEEQGTQFSTYAWYWCRKYANDAYRVLRAPVTTSHTKTQVQGSDFEIDEDEGYSTSLSTPSPEDDILDVVERAREVGVILGAMNTLTESEMVCVRLYHGVDCEPMNTSEIAKVMGFSRQAAHQNMTRGVNKLKEVLA